MLTAIIVILGTIALFISKQRTKVVKESTNWLLQAASAMLEEARTYRIEDDPTFLKLYNQMITTAAIAPNIATFPFVTDHSKYSVDEIFKRDVERLLTRHYWITGYAIVTYYAASRLEFQANPHVIRTWVPNIMANLLYWGKSKSDGMIQLPIVKRDATRKIVSVELKPTGKLIPA